MICPRREKLLVTFRGYVFREYALCAISQDRHARQRDGQHVIINLFYVSMLLCETLRLPCQAMTSMYFSNSIFISFFIFYFLFFIFHFSLFFAGTRCWRCGGSLRGSKREVDEAGGGCAPVAGGVHARQRPGADFC